MEDLLNFVFFFFVRYPVVDFEFSQFLLIFFRIVHKTWSLNGGENNNHVEMTDQTIQQ